MKAIINLVTNAAMWALGLVAIVAIFSEPSSDANWLASAIGSKLVGAAAIGLMYLIRAAREESFAKRGEKPQNQSSAGTM